MQLFSLLIATIIPIVPADRSMVESITRQQREIMALKTYEERLELLRNDRDGEQRLQHHQSEKYRTAPKFSFEWEVSPGEKGPWEVRVAKNPEMKAARVFLSEERPKQGKVQFFPRYANFEVGETYYWQVIGNAKCPVWGHGRHCQCERSVPESASKVVSFTVEDQPPRWITVRGTVGNIRDLGGWKTHDGFRVRQGMIYRGQGLNDNSITGEDPGFNRLMVEDVRYLTGELGIRTDLDLRGHFETAGMKTSPLGKGVKYISNSSKHYRELFSDQGKERTAINFRVFCDRANYPIYFHCIAGADRTGSLAYILNGLLGVSQHDLEVDWEATFYPELPEMRGDYCGENYWARKQHLDAGFAKYGQPGDSLQKRIALYLIDCGITLEQIQVFRSIMLTR